MMQALLDQVQSLETGKRVTFLPVGDKSCGYAHTILACSTKESLANARSDIPLDVTVLRAGKVCLVL